MKARIFSSFRGAASLALATLLAVAAPVRLAAADIENPSPAAAAPVAADAATTQPAPAVPETPAQTTPPSVVPSVELPNPTSATPSVHVNDRGDLVTIGSNSLLRKDERANDMVTIMGNALVEGRVRNDSVTVLGSVVVNGTVSGDLVCVLGQVTLGPGAEVNGDVVSVGGGVVLDPTARIRGEKVEIPFFSGIGLPAITWLTDWIHDALLWGRMLPHNHPWAWVTAAVFLLINVLFAAIFRRPVEAAVANLERKPVMCFLAGLFSLMLVGPVLVLFSITVVGLLVVPFIVAGMFIAWYTGVLSVYRYCAEQLGVRGMPLVALLVGNVLFVLLYAVPALGIAVWGVTSLIGLGAAMTSFFEGMRRERQAGKSRTAPDAPTTPPAPTNTPSTPASAPTTSSTPSTPAPAVVEGGAASMAFVATPPNPDPANESSLFTAPITPTFTPPPSPPPAPTPRIAVPPLPPVETLERAGLPPRLAALALDLLFIGAAHLFVPLLAVFPFTLIVVAYHIAFWSWRGTTPGGIVMNVRIERLDGGPMTPAIAVVRALAGIFSVIPGGLGFWWVGWDEGQQSWHDKIAGTIVVRTTRAQSFV